MTARAALPLNKEDPIERAVAAERERCALIAENYPIVAPSSEIVIQTTMEVAAESIAATIRNGPG